MYNYLLSLYTLQQFSLAKDYFPKSAVHLFKEFTQFCQGYLCVHVCAHAHVHVHVDRCILEMIPGLQTASFSLYLHMAESRAEEASSFMTLPIKAPIPFMKALCF